MPNTDEVPDCLVFNLPLFKLHQVIAGAQQVDGICLEFPAVWSHCSDACSYAICIYTCSNAQEASSIHLSQGVAT